MVVSNPNPNLKLCSLLSGAGTALKKLIVKNILSKLVFFLVQIKIFNLIIKSNLDEFKVFHDGGKPAKVIQLPNLVLTQRLSSINKL